MKAAQLCSLMNVRTMCVSTVTEFCLHKAWIPWNPALNSAFVMESQFVSINLVNDINSCSNKMTKINNLLEEQIVVIHST